MDTASVAYGICRAMTNTQYSSAIDSDRAASLSPERYNGRLHSETREPC